MTHRAETILQAVEANLAGLATTGARVKRGLVWFHYQYPALTIQKGEDNAAEDEYQLDDQVRRLEFTVVCLVEQTGNLETALNAVAAEVYAALMADHTQGLSFANDTALIGDSAPYLSEDVDIPVGRMECRYSILYGHSAGSAEA